MISIANTLEGLINLVEKYTSDMEKAQQSTKSFKKYKKMASAATLEFKTGLSSIKDASNNASNGMDKINSKMAELISKAKLGKRALDFFKSGIKNAENQQVQKISMQSMLGSKSAGSALYDYAEAYGAQKSVLGVDGTINATKAFAPLTRDMGQLNQMYGLAERLYARDPSQGADTAISSVQSLLSGDASAVQGNYNITGVDENTVTGLTGSGDMGGAIDYLTGVFDEFGATQETVMDNFNSLQTQAAMFGQNMQFAMGDQSGAVVQGLAMMLQQLNEQLLNGGFDWFFNVVGNGMQMLGSAIQWVAENSNILIPVLSAVVIALTIYQTAMKMAAIMTEVMNLASGITSGNIIQIIGAITGSVAGVAAFAALDKLLPDTTDNKGIFKEMKEAQETAQSAMDKQKAQNPNANSKTAGLSASPLQTEVTNTAPIPVTGKMEIEKEVLRYQFDLAAQKAMAVFRMQQYVPQVIIQNQNVSQTADLNEINHSLGDIVYQNLQTQPAGVYA